MPESIESAIDSICLFAISQRPEHPATKCILKPLLKPVTPWRQVRQSKANAWRGQMSCTWVAFSHESSAGHTQDFEKLSKTSTGQDVDNILAG